MKTQTQPSYSFGTLVFRPRIRQYFANDLIITIVCIAGLAVAGIDGMFMGNILLWASLAIALCLIYRFLYLRSMRFVITDEQFIYEHGVFQRTRDFMNSTVCRFREESSFLQQLFGLKPYISIPATVPHPALTWWAWTRAAILSPLYVNV